MDMGTGLDGLVVYVGPVRDDHYNNCRKHFDLDIEFIIISVVDPDNFAPDDPDPGPDPA